MSIVTMRTKRHLITLIRLRTLVGLSVLTVVMSLSCTAAPKPDAGPLPSEEAINPNDEPECLIDGDCEGDLACYSGYCVKPHPSEPIIIDASADLPSPSPPPLSPIYFDFDESRLTPGARGVLGRNAGLLDGPVTLVGHCDSRGTGEYNLELGEQRARAVRRYLEHLGVDGGTLGLMSKGENELVCLDDAEWCHRRNRRVTFVPL